MSDDLVKRLRAFARHPMMDNNCKADVFDVSEAAARIEALTAQLAQRDAALKAADDLLEAVTHDREMVCQDYDMQFKASQSVERCLDAYLKARGQDAD